VRADARRRRRGADRRGCAGDALAESIARPTTRGRDGVRVEARRCAWIALQQPVVASDLRLVFVALKATTDIERIGDHCVNVARLGRQMRREGVFYKPLIDIPLLAGLGRSMLHEALESIVHHDAERARAVIAADERTDDLYRRMRGSCRTRWPPGSRTRPPRAVPPVRDPLPGAGRRPLHQHRRAVVFLEGPPCDSPRPDEPSGSA
jgi:phosphate uptake regulator